MIPPRALYLASVWLHVVAAILWAGGMLFLVAVLVPLLRTPALRGQAATLVGAVGERFRTVGWIALVVLVVTGFLNTLFHAASPATLADAAFWETPFGRLLAFKLAVVGLLLVLSAVHDFAIGPRATALLRDDPGSARAARWRDAARWMGRANLVLALVVIAAAVALARGGL